VVAKLRERLSVSKGAEQKSGMQRFYLRKLNEVVKEQKPIRLKSQTGL
jgi:hypothetical protein